MKQLIVMISTIILGIAIAVIIMGFQNDAADIKDSVTERINEVVLDFSTGSGIN